MKLLIVSLTTALPFVLYNQALTSSLFQLPFLFLLLELEGWKVLGRGSSKFSLSEFHLHVFSSSHISSFHTRNHPFSHFYSYLFFCYSDVLSTFLDSCFYHILEYNYTVLLYCSFFRSPLFRHHLPGGPRKTGRDISPEFGSHPSLTLQYLLYPLSQWLSRPALPPIPPVPPSPLLQLGGIVSTSLI